MRVGELNNMNNLVTNELMVQKSNSKQMIFEFDIPPSSINNLGGIFYELNDKDEIIGFTPFWIK